MKFIFHVMARRSKRARRSSTRPRRVASKTRRRSRSSSRRAFRKARRAQKLSVSRFKALYPDVFLTKLKDFWTDARPTVGIDWTNPLDGTGAPTQNCTLITLNGNPKGGVFIEYKPDGIPPVPGAFNPNPSNTLMSRYRVYRPMAAKVKVIVTGDSGTGNNVAPFKVVCFPYCTGSDLLSNFWSEDPAVGPFTPEQAMQFKYAFSGTAEGRGGKSSVTLSKYINFAKLGGFTPDQYMADGSATCNTTTINDPQYYFKLCVAIVDWTPSSNPNKFNVQVFLKQYGRWETAFLYYV